VVTLLPERWKACVLSDRALAAERAAKSEAGASNTVQIGAAGGQVLALLGEDPVDIDHVIERSGLGAGRVSAALLDLELAGRVRQIEGKRFVRIGRG
jgi:predicted Rossmann fold nucleotide-binding protein DprA/Smf involved in DNA uptake